MTAKPSAGTWQELIGKALTNGQLTKTQASSLLRHRKHHSSGRMLYMIRAMIERHLSFKDAHAQALLQVGR